MRKAFTLIELLISIVILTILMLFLYKSYAALNRSNTVLAQELTSIEKFEKVKKVLYMDFTLALKSKKIVTILKQDRNADVVFLQTKNSLHKRVNPYVAYVFKEHKLYRLESLKPFKEYPFTADVEFVADYLGEVDTFRVYESKRAKSKVYLVHILFADAKEILLKIKPLNS